MIFKNKRSILLLFLIVTLVFVPAQMLVRAESTSDNTTEEVIGVDNAQVNQPATEDRNVEFVPSDFDPSEWEMDTTNTDAYVLQKYIGNKTDIYIPGKHTDGKHVIIESLKGDSLAGTLFLKTATKNLKIEAVDGVKVRILDNDANNGFAMLWHLQTADLRGLDVSNITSMVSLFLGAEKLTTINISNWDTSNVTNMAIMFAFCRMLTTIDVSSFNTSKVTNMAAMFSQAENLMSIDLSGFDTSSVEQMQDMFVNTPKLNVIDLSGFDTSNVTLMTGMFNNWQEQERLIISDDPKFLNYDYQSEKNIPRKITTLDANGGQFADGTTQKEYVFSSVAVSPASILPPEEDAFLQQIPENEPKTFAGWNPGFPDSILSMKDTIYYATWKIVPKLVLDPQIVELPLNDPSWGTTLMATDGVSWADPLDTNGVFHPVTTMAPTAYQDDSATAVDIHIPGVYHVRYVITNSSGETVEGTRSYTVGAQAVGTEYAVFANDFDRNLTDAVNDSDTEIILNADAKAILLADGMTLGTVEVLSKTGYGTTAGTYPITFTVSEEDTVQASINAYIYDEVIPSLPATGEQTMEVMIVAVIILLISLIGLITIKQKQKN